MGDFNDTPTNASILKILKAAPTLTEAKKQIFITHIMIYKKKKD